MPLGSRFFNARDSGVSSLDENIGINNNNQNALKNRKREKKLAPQWIAGIRLNEKENEKNSLGKSINVRI